MGPVEANKDEALRCISMAKSRLASGNTEAAKRLVLKARKLFPSVELNGMEFLVRSSQSPPRARESSGTRNRRHSNVTPEDENNAVFTKAQTEAVRKVLACKDYYELLNVSKESSEEEIRRAYKSLALKFHPDKNRAPGSTEAFKKIGTALGVLTDPEKRRRYDQFGTDEEMPRITRVHRHGDPFFQYDTDVFTMFFNGGFPFSHAYQRNHRPRQAESDRESNYFVYVQLIPLILIFVMSCFSNFFVKEPFYSLTSTGKYNIPRTTSEYSVTYYVKPTFKSDLDGHLSQLEAEIIEDYHRNLRIRCFRERDYREKLLHQASFYGDSAGYERAKRMQLQSCDRLTQVFG